MTKIIPMTCYFIASALYNIEKLYGTELMNITYEQSL